MLLIENVRYKPVWGTGRGDQNVLSIKCFMWYTMLKGPPGIWGTWGLPLTWQADEAGHDLMTEEGCR